MSYPFFYLFKAKLVLKGTKVDIALEVEGIWVSPLAPSLMDSFEHAKTLPL